MKNRIGMSVATLAALTVSAASIVGVGAQSTPPLFAHPAFERVWNRTDSLVLEGRVPRSWYWGPHPDSPGLYETLTDAPDGSGHRLVQYFDKSRMEINDPTADPNSPFFVTNGLLTVELISGRMQTGKASFVTRQPSRTNVTGDQGDALAPTYASFAGVANAGQDHRDP